MRPWLGGVAIAALAFAGCSEDPTPAPARADTEAAADLGTDGGDTSIPAMDAAGDPVDNDADGEEDVRQPDLLEEDTADPLPEMPTTRPGWPGDFCADFADAAVNEGRATYEAQCASCHGADALGAELGPPVAFPAIDYAAWVTRNGRDLLLGHPVAMDAYSEDSLSDRQLCEILTYLQSFEKPENGEELFNVFCSTCHGFGGDGAGIANESLGRFLSRPSEFFDINRSGHGGSNYGAARQYMPARDSEELTNAEIQLIVDYLSSL